MNEHIYKLIIKFLEFLLDVLELGEKIIEQITKIIDKLGDLFEELPIVNGAD